MEEHTKHYLISGRVQGVGFRRFTEGVALDLKVRGWVRNLQDGRVEVMAQGPADRLEQFETQLKKGPAHGHVEGLVIRSLHNPQKCEGFTLRKDGSEPCSEN
jgi:acylphosphatase